MQKSDFKSMNFSLFGLKSELDGQFSFHGDVIIAGKLKGYLNILDDGHLTIERTAIVEANIHCHDLEIFGDFSGSIHSAGKVTIRSSANVSGTLKAKSMSIFPGANLNIEGDAEEF